MAPPKVPELVGYQATAAELRRIADALDMLPGSPGFVSLDIQPLGGETRADVIDAVDAVGCAVIGPAARSSEGGGLYSIRRYGPRVSISVYQRIPRALEDSQAEIRRLKAELAEVRSKPTT